MIKYAAILAMIFLTTACAARQIQTTDKAVYYMPANIEITVADGISVSDSVILAIKSSMKEYVDDRGWWNENAKPVNLSVKINDLNDASVAAVLVGGLLADPATMTGELTIIDGEKKRIFPIKASSRNNPFSAMYGKSGMNERLASYFASEVMAQVQKPFSE